MPSIYCQCPLPDFVLTPPLQKKHDIVLQVHAAMLIHTQEIDELLGQNLTQEDEDAIAEELESILLVRNTWLYNHYLMIEQAVSRRYMWH